MRPSPPPPGSPEPASRSAPGLPDDADDLRGYHFRELTHKPWTWVLIGGGALLLGVVFLAAFSAALGAIVFVIAVLGGLSITFRIGDSRAADDFFHVYAQTRGLELGGRSSLPAVTPL